MSDNQKSEPVWYLSYGSNLQEERFMCYIQGGHPVGSDKDYKGCANKIRPKTWLPDEIRYPLYFAYPSSTWNGGIAFIRTTESREETPTIARRYLITKGQLEGVAAQENSKCDGDTDYAIDFESLTVNGSLTIGTRLYDYLILLGYYNGVPIITLTTSRTLALLKPSSEYVTVIARGLRETHGMSPEDVCSYLYEKDGIKGRYERTLLLAIIRKAFEETAAGT